MSLQTIYRKFELVSVNVRYTIIIKFQTKHAQSLNKIHVRNNQIRSMFKKRKSKAWTLVNMCDMDAYDHVETIKDKVSKGQCMR